MMSTEAFEDIVETFEFLDDWEDRYRHLIEIGFLSPAESPRIAEAAEQRLKLAAGAREPAEGSSGAPTGKMGQCPNCGAAALTHQEGCDICLNCGYSRCG